MKTLQRDSDAILDYTWDWALWLGTDTIASATVTGNGCTIVSDTNTTTTVTAWISGGSVNTAPPSATCHITTTGGRQEDRTIVFQMLDR